MSIDVSIVSGTFNRLPYLKRMIESGRKAMRPAGHVHAFEGVTWEFVIVDGGSTDGTLDWLRSQADVRVIEHGRLLGAGCRGGVSGRHSGDEEDRQEDDDDQQNFLKSRHVSPCCWG